MLAVLADARCDGVSRNELLNDRPRSTAMGAPITTGGALGSSVVDDGRPATMALYALVLQLFTAVSEAGRTPRSVTGPRPGVVLRPSPSPAAACDGGRDDALGERMPAPGVVDRPCMIFSRSSALTDVRPSALLRDGAVSRGGRCDAWATGAGDDESVVGAGPGAGDDDSA